MIYLGLKRLGYDAIFSRDQNIGPPGIVNNLGKMSKKA